MKEIDVREYPAGEVGESMVRVKFGEDGEFLKYSQGSDVFSVSEGSDTLYIYVSDIPNLRKALDRLEEFVVQIEEESGDVYPV